MRSLVLLLALVGCALASYDKPAVVQKHVVEKTVYKSAGYGGPGKGAQVYHGKYGGKCYANRTYDCLYL